MATLIEQFPEDIEKMMERSLVEKNRVVTPANVYQPAHLANRPPLGLLIRSLLLPGSGILGLENLLALSELAAQGKSCLLLPSHTSNFDVPLFWTLMELAGPEYARIFEKIVFVAGRKLNEEHRAVLMFTEMFARVVISPKTFSGSLSGHAEQERLESESKAINLAAHRAIHRLKASDHIILVYPTGTRFRPWEPATGRGLREVETYLRIFDHFVVGATRGNLMPPEPGVSMAGEHPRQDRAVMHFGPVVKTADFRERCLAELAACPDGGAAVDQKQYLVDRIMDMMHDLENAIPGDGTPDAVNNGS
jgi:glycerol-3-phosphate O-acyltransferase